MSAPGRAESAPAAVRPDLDTRARIEDFVELFYGRMLGDPVLGPIFLDVAAVDLEQHLPHIRNYWCKLLLGGRDYQRHTMNIHRRVHRQRPLAPADFERWLDYFTATVRDHFEGPRAERAVGIARTIAANMQAGIDTA